MGRGHEQMSNRKERKTSWAYIYNLNYFGGRGRRIKSSRPAQVKVAVRPCLKNKIKTKGLGNIA
jgi:hypothetical protein